MASSAELIVLVNQCMPFIIGNDYKKAYSLICEFEVSQQYPRGINIDWKLESKEHSLLDEQLYRDIKSVDLLDIDDEEMLKNVAILCDMTGIQPQKKRFSKWINLATSLEVNLDLSCYNHQSQTNYLPYVQFLQSLISSIGNLKDLKRDEIEEYKIITSNSCSFCKVTSLKSYFVKEARFGKNCPPFGIGCTCCICAKT